MNLRTLKNAIRNKTWVFLKAKWKLRSGVEVVVKNDSDWFVFNEIFTNGEYEKALRLFLSKQLTNPLVLDLGANVGYFSIKMADELLYAGISNFSIVAIEASPYNYSVLQERLNQKPIAQKIKALWGLAGYKTGAEEIIHSTEHYGHSTKSDSIGETRKVSYVNIEELVPSNSKIDFLKCDIEGSEEIFINEYQELLNRVETAVFEFHANECNVENCRVMLQAAGLFSVGVLKTEEVYKTSVELFMRRN
jgi:FkbM family methyltransferase